MESRPQNLEFRNNPENFYPCTLEESHLDDTFTDHQNKRKTGRDK